MQEQMPFFFLRLKLSIEELFCMIFAKCVHSALNTLLLWVMEETVIAG